MKVAILAESDADEAVIRTLVAAIRQEEIELYAAARRRPGGWTGVLGVVRTVIRELHFNRWDVTGLVVVLDSDETDVHTAEHDKVDLPGNCRLCQLRHETHHLLQSLTPCDRPQPVKVALGLAVPAIEAWLRCGRDPHVNETTWANGLKSANALPPYNKKTLKRAVYGTDRPDRTLAQKRCQEEAQRLAIDLGALWRCFPGGFGFLAETLKSW